MESRHQKGKGLGKFEQGIKELLADMLKSNSRKRGIEVKDSEESSVLANSDDESRSKLDEKIINMVELVPKSPKVAKSHRRTCIYITGSANATFTIHIDEI